MNKKTLPILALFLIVIVCVAILVQNLSAPSAIPAAVPATASTTYSISPDSTVVPSSLPQAQSQQANASAAAPDASSEKLAIIWLSAPDGTIKTEVASTSAQQAQGLGDRDSLPADQGMIFPFTYPGDYGFWMKDMKFPLDMVWISSNKRVVSVTPDISADTYPAVFYPPTAISYVLELNAGAAREFGIATGTQLSF